MKKRNGVIAALMAAALVIGIAVGWMLSTKVEDATGNYSNEMKMDYRTDYADFCSCEEEVTK